MKGILVLAHGSRKKKTEETLNQIVDMVKEMLPDALIKSGYMEFSERNIEKALGELVNDGCSEIVVVPYFLFEGIHIHEDIPNEINEFLEKHPNIKITMGSTLGADRRLAEVLCDRIKEVM